MNLSQVRSGNLGACFEFDTELVDVDGELADAFNEVAVDPRGHGIEPGEAASRDVEVLERGQRRAGSAA